MIIYGASDSRSGVDTNEGLLCWNCRHIVPFSIEKRIRKRNVGNTEYEYTELVGVCKECHSEIYIPGLDDENEKRFEAYYRRLNGIVSGDDIYALMDKYAIEKRPLSHLLGFGEHTISRYIEGQIPQKKYSDILKTLLYDHHEMRKVLEEGKDRITSVAYKKVLNRLELMDGLTNCDNKVDLVALYIVNSDYDITDLSLQKLLYFVKGFSLAVFGKKPIFEEQCEAWAYGPVFPTVYEKYKVFKKEVISDIYVSDQFFSGLSAKEKSIIDFVLANYGKYNGKVLMDITHSEEPWNIARYGLETFESSHNVITDESIREYYTGINSRFDLKTKDGIVRYIDFLLEEN
ncbi:MAG: DUF4065 domain-containing protein [Butyrivibrio sp.]|nr:DUF4065 domain-containing protein [Butyrivibrio sp.]